MFCNNYYHFHYHIHYRPRLNCCRNKYGHHCISAITKRAFQISLRKSSFFLERMCCNVVKVLKINEIMKFECRIESKNFIRTSKLKFIRAFAAYIYRRFEVLVHVWFKALKEYVLCTNDGKEQVKKLYPQTKLLDSRTLVENEEIGL